MPQLIECSRGTWGVLDVSKEVLECPFSIISGAVHSLARLTALPGDLIGSCTDPDAVETGSLFGDMAWCSRHISNVDP